MKIAIPVSILCLVVAGTLAGASVLAAINHGNPLWKVSTILLWSALGVLTFGAVVALAGVSGYDEGKESK